MYISRSDAVKICPTSTVNRVVVSSSLTGSQMGSVAQLVEHLQRTDRPFSSQQFVWPAGLCRFLLLFHSRSHIYLWYCMAKRKTLKKVEQPKPIVDEVPTPAPVAEKHGPATLFECMMRRRAKEK